jgi:hypothetical protein
VQKQLSDALDRELSLEPYNDLVPPGYSPDNLTSDPGFSDLSQDEYVVFRLENRLAWFIKDNQRLQGQRTRLVMMILLIGGAGAILAALGGPLTVWSGIIVALAFAQFGWNELRKVEKNIRQKNKIIAELMEIYENSNDPNEENQDKQDYFKLVYLTEKVTWNQNVDYIQSVEQVLLTQDSDILVWSALLDGSTFTRVDYPDTGELSTEIEMVLDEDRELDHIDVEYDADPLIIQDDGGPAEEALSHVDAEIGSINEADDRVDDVVDDSAPQEEFDETDVQKNQIQSTIANTISEVVEEYSDTTFTKNTSISVINEVLNRFESIEQDDSES